MRKTLTAGLVYFAIVLGTGFVLGVIRVPFLVPRLGERWAELLEMPIMATVIFFASRYVLRRFPEVDSVQRGLVAGFFALAFTVTAELSMAVAFQSRSLSDYIASRDKVSGSVYLFLLLVFALAPAIRLARRT